MASSNSLQMKNYHNINKIAFALLLYVIRPYITNPTYNTIFIIIYFALITAVVYDFIYEKYTEYLSKMKKNYEKDKIKYVFTTMFILILVLSYMLYKLIGLGPGLYIAVFGGLIAYITTLAVVLMNKKKKK